MKDDLKIKKETAAIAKRKPVKGPYPGPIDKAQLILELVDPMKELVEFLKAHGAVAHINTLYQMDDALYLLCKENDELEQNLQGAAISLMSIYTQKHLSNPLAIRGVKDED